MKTVSFHNPICKGADPWMFPFEGKFYLCCTAGRRITLWRAADPTKIQEEESIVAFEPEEGHEWSLDLWSPEIHYFAPEDFGKAHAGWYLFIACDDGQNVNHRMYVLKSEDPHSPFAHYGNPITGARNVPEKFVSPIDPDFNTAWCCGQTILRACGNVYAMWVDEVGRQTEDFHQRVRLADAGAFPAGVTTLNYEQATNMWYNNEAAMFFNGQWEITTSDAYLGESADWIPIPASTEEDIETSQYAFVGGTGTAAGLGVSAWSENYDVAVEVACYLAEKYAEYNFTQRGAATVAVQCDKPVEVEPPAMMSKLGEWMPKITSTTVLAGSGGNMELYTVLGEGTQSLLAGVMTPEEFIESIAFVLGE